MQDCFLQYLLSYPSLGSEFFAPPFSASSSAAPLSPLSPFLTTRAADLFCLEKSHQLKIFENIFSLSVAICASVHKTNRLLDHRK